ncbi:Bgt-20328 [Blumeria graminis f. sp. tritici]|uniref:Bgt-20328 n=2 Tax=Blumeria graminis f. sp. tritici TaxID=62690 RepID=A0A381L3Q1_BLUGR|nr:Bgt-20328 [Blumeria graminis f. sp. tritici]
MPEKSWSKVTIVKEPSLASKSRYERGVVELFMYFRCPPSQYIRIKGLEGT